MNEIDKPKRAIIMRNGIATWIDEDRAAKLEEMLASATKHLFVKIDGMTISSNEIEGIYTMEEFQNWTKVKQGMWQCEYRTWHNKGKRECECKADFYKRQAQAKKDRDAAASNRPMTDAERAHVSEKMHQIGDSMRAKGILPEKKLPPPPKPVAAGTDLEEDDDSDGMPDFTE